MICLRHLDQPTKRGYTLPAIGGKMIRNQPIEQRTHELKLQLLRHERRTEKLHLDKLKETLKVKLPPLTQPKENSHMA
jgi:hypothetical protein